jgi:hypothetical protein
MLIIVTSKILLQRLILLFRLPVSLWVESSIKTLAGI